jgi:hypothetical protein
MLSERFLKRLLPQDEKDKKDEVVIYDTEEIKKLITLWTIAADCTLDDFSSLLKLLGVQTPIKLLEFNCICDSYEDKTYAIMTNSKYTLEIHFGSAVYFETYILLYTEEKQEALGYIMNNNAQFRDITIGAQTLYAYYNENCSKIALDTNEFNLSIYVEYREDEQAKILGLNQMESFENYLLSLEDFNEQDLRNKLTDKLYSYYDMSHIKNILINKKDK